MNFAPVDQKLTQKQLADHLGVSRQLVGMALSGQGKVAAATRQKILDAARENGYDQFSNSEARRMISRRYGKRAATGVLAVLFASDFENQPLSTVPYFTPIFRGLELEAKASGFDLTLCPIRPGELPRLVRDRQLDGVICLSLPHEVSRAVAALEMAVVNIQSDVEGIACVLRDDFGGGLQATRHLLQLGHRQMAYLGFDAPSGHARQAAFCQALGEYGVADSALVNGSLTEPTQQQGETAMRRMLGTNGQGAFSALVAHNDLIAMGAIRALQAAGLRVPHDVSVIGFDDVAQQYDFKPALTSICFAREAMGRRAIQMLAQLTENLDQAAPLREIFSTRLVQRNSTRAPEKRKF